MKQSHWRRTTLVAAMVTLLAVAVLPSLSTSHTHQVPIKVSAYQNTSDPIATGNWQFDQYDSIIVAEAQSHGLDPFMVKGQILLESWFNPNAISQWGDLGLMQLKAYTFQALGYTGSWSGMFDPQTNIEYGCMELQQLMWQFGDMSLALQAYNIGSWNVAHGGRNWAYSNQVYAYAQMFKSEHDSIYGQQQQQNNGHYSVQSGDFLYEIAMKYKVNWQSIAEANGINPPYLIYPNQVLVIPS